MNCIVARYKIKGKNFRKNILVTGFNRIYGLR